MVKPNPDGDVQHSEFMYFVDRNGVEQYIADPMNSRNSIAQFGQGIAYYANKLV